MINSNSGQHYIFQVYIIFAYGYPADWIQLTLVHKKSAHSHCILLTADAVGLPC